MFLDIICYMPDNLNDRELQIKLDFEEKDLYGARILLVDDNKMNILIAKKFITKWNGNVDCCENGKEAIELASSKKYHLILMDLEMPGIDGFEATRQIRKSNKNIPVIALTASDCDEIKNKMNDCKMTGYISKPFKSEELFSGIKKYLR